MDAMLARLAKRCTPATAIDVGSSDGRWSELALRHWPDAKLLLIEANPAHYPALDAFRERTGARVVYGMAGDHCGVGHFEFAPDPFGGAGRAEATARTDEIHCTTIDAAVDRHDLPGPYLLKLDTHGFEGPILAGAAKTLESACLLVIEAYTCVLQPGAMRFWELCALLEGKGFVPTDMAEPMWRPLDGRLWQFDLCFERASAPHVGEGRYK